MRLSTAHNTLRRSITLLAITAFIAFAGAPPVLHAQGAYSISTVTANNGFDVIMFEVTALKSTKLHRFWNTFNTGTGTVEIWARSGGIVANNNTGWIFLGQTTVTATSNTAYTEIPFDLDFLINPNETWGFAIFCATPGVRYRTGATPYVFTDSYLSVDTQFYGGSGTTNPTTNTVNFDFGNYPRQFCGRVTYDEGITGPNDAGISSIDSPQNFCAGQQDVIVTLHNYGTDQLASARINWTLNGAPQTSYNWSGLLDTLGASSRETQVTLASMNFQSGIPYTIAAWTTLPNGVADTINSNDSSIVTVQAAIAGTFTIGGTSPDYPTFTDAVNDLNLFGVCGPVLFNVRPGSYDEQISLASINGTSAINTITFQSETGNRADVELRHAAAGTPDNYVVQMNGASFVTFKNLSITAAGSTYGRVLAIIGSSTDNVFESLELTGVNSNTTSTNIAVVYSPSGTLNHRTTIRDCGIREGSYGMYLYGASSSSREEDVQLIGNDFTGQYNRMMNCYYLSRPRIHDNRGELLSTYSGAYFIYSNSNADLSFERNSFVSNGGGTRYGIYLGSSQGSVNRCVNNFITILNNGSSTTRALYLSSANNVLAAHNSIFINCTSTTNGRGIYQTSGSGIRFINNIVHNDGAGYALYANTPTAIVESDFNILYTNGNNLAYWSGARSNLAALQAASGMDAQSLTKRVTFKNTMLGDLHLSGASEDDEDLFGTLLAEVVQDIDGDMRVNPYRGADEACYVIPGSLTYAFVDGSGQQAAFAEAPGTMGVRYGITFPEYAALVTITLNFLDVRTNAVMWQTSFTVTKQQGSPLLGTRYITIPTSLAAGAYKVAVTFNTKNSCDSYRDYSLDPSALLIVPEGRQPCVVWPGDANNDGIVNYTDRRDLNYYMYNANLRASWLQGPARYRADAEINPLTYLEWEPQAAAPWYTSDGCYMDTDGNGMINNLDYLAMKLNWSKLTPWYGGAPKSGVTVASFTMDQNYPNPFNPSTSIRYAVPEASHVYLVVTNALGRHVAELENGRVDAGVHEVQFDGSALASGTYIATITMTGVESGLTFTKTSKMVLNK